MLRGWWLLLKSIPNITRGKAGFAHGRWHKQRWESKTLKFVGLLYSGPVRPNTYSRYGTEGNPWTYFSVHFAVTLTETRSILKAITGSSVLYIFMASRASYKPEGNIRKKNLSQFPIRLLLPSTLHQFGEQEYLPFEIRGFEEIRFVNPTCFVCQLRESLMRGVKTKQTYETAVFAFKQTLIDWSNE